MYAIVRTGGKQYKVTTDEVLDVEKIEGNVGDKIQLEVVFLNDGKKIITDPKKLDKAKVTAKILDQHKGEKPIVSSLLSFKLLRFKQPPVLASQRLKLRRLKSYPSNIGIEFRE